MTAEEEDVAFDALSETEPTNAFAIHIVILHRLTSRASLRDLQRILDRLAVRPSERLNFVLEVAPTCCKAVLKAEQPEAYRAWQSDPLNFIIHHNP